jgi:hypothetical protein
MPDRNRMINQDDPPDSRLDDDDPAEQGRTGEKDLPPNVERERPGDQERQSER